MKIFLYSMITFLAMTASQFAFAETVIIEETKDWTGIPIVVDEEKHTFVPPHYYYSYQGHRCFAEKHFPNVVAAIFNDPDGTSIYCYPE